MIPKTENLFFDKTENRRIITNIECKDKQNKDLNFPMPTIHSKYLGELRTEAVHCSSGEKLITDAPVDNQGKGQSFSPTDLLTASLTSCMMTIMGIAARTHGIAINGIEAETTKHMASDPRRVIKIEIRFFGFPTNYSDKEKAILEKAAYSCPVAMSLSEGIEQEILFDYGLN